MRAKPRGGPHSSPQQTHKTHKWWQVMCLTGVDYFSTLGYQPGIAALAAGAISPIATLVLVALTLIGALPVYRRVASESPNGEGSFAMLERLMSFWQGKIFVLVLLGFAATDFMITMTLSAADATAHLVENPHLEPFLSGHQIIITLILLALLGGVFLRGFKEAISVAVILVAIYLVLNVVVIADRYRRGDSKPLAVVELDHRADPAAREPAGDRRYRVTGLSQTCARPLRLRDRCRRHAAHRQRARRHSRASDRSHSGRQTSVDHGRRDHERFLDHQQCRHDLADPAGRVEPGGSANGRALAYLAHEYLGSTFGSVYDASTIAILWFAGASAMAGLLNLIPRFLPRYGMAPQWARAVRPLVLILILGAFLITIIFRANVDAQGGAYATGVLVVITSAAIAVTLAARHARQHKLAVGFGLVALIFVYTTIANIIERPEGVRIAAIFIAAIIAVSLASRFARSFELRATSVTFDPTAQLFIRDTARRTIRFIAKEPDRRQRSDYSDKLRQVSRDNDLTDPNDVIFVEVTVTDPSEFAGKLDVQGEVQHDRYRVITFSSSSVPNALAALLLAVRDNTHRLPHIYFEWTEGNPAANLLRFLFFGVGEVAPVTREVIRRAEPDRDRRPHVHAG